MSLFAPTGGRGLKFPTPGTSHTGKVSRAPYEKQQTKFGTQDPDYWPNGDPKMQIVVELDTDERDPNESNDDGARTLYVSSGVMKRAIADAMLKAGADDIEVGGILTVTYTGNDPQSKNPANPKKLYEAAYQKPVPPLAQAAPQQAPAAATQQAAPAPQAVQAQPGWASQVTPEVADKITQMQSIGLDSAAIAAALGIPQEAVINELEKPF